MKQKRKVFVVENGFVRESSGGVATGEVAYDSDGNVVVAQVSPWSAVERLIKDGYQPEEIYVQRWMNLKGEELV